MSRGRRLFLWSVCGGVAALAFLWFGSRERVDEAPASTPAHAGRPCSLTTLRWHVEAARQAHAALSDYTATMKKQERVDGELMPLEDVDVRFRKPHDVYMKWVGDVHRGREVLFGSGVSGGKLLVHNGSFPDVTLELEPTGALATRGTRHSIHDAGLGFIIDRVAADLDRAAAREPGAIELLEFPGARGPCFEIRFSEVDCAGRDAAEVELCMDTQLRLPVRIAVRDADGELIESSEYSELRVDVGLTDRDFDRANPDYRF